MRPAVIAVLTLMISEVAESGHTVFSYYRDRTLNHRSEVLEADSPFGAAGSARLLGAEVPPLGVPLGLGADIPP
jgi:hypothetical protein